MYLDYHTHSFDNDSDVISIVNQYPLKEIDTSHPFSIGIHPWYISLDTLEEELNFIEQLAPHPNCLAIGECGLDRLSKVPLTTQIQVFKKQIHISETLKKPLTIHCVKAFSEIISLKKELKPTQKWVIHGFRKNKQIAQSLLKNGIKLSFGIALIHDTKVQEIFKQIPKNTFYLETDDAKISIKDIYQKAKELKPDFSSTL